MKSMIWPLMHYLCLCYWCIHLTFQETLYIHTYRYLFSKKIAKDIRGSWLHFMFLILSWSQWVVAWIFDTWEFDLQPGFCLSPRRIKNRVINSAWQNNREEKLGSRILKILWYSSKYSSSSKYIVYLLCIIYPTL